MTWNHAVKQLVWVEPDQLLANPENARRHPGAQRDALREMIERVGFAAPVIVNTTTGFVVDGHARIEEALSAGVQLIPVIEVELTLEQEREFLAGFDATTLLAIYDESALTNLLNGIEPFDTVALQTTLENLARLYSDDANDADSEYEGMPDYGDPDDERGPYHKLILNFGSNEDIESFASLIGQTVTNRTKYIWIPPRENIREQSVIFE